MTRILKLDRSMKRSHGHGGFGIEILYPGLAQSAGDSGIGAIGRIDHARVSPGTVVSMHPHKNDEILTYLRSGRVRHFDTVGNTEDLSNTRLMLMNAGHTFQHEERVLNDGGALQGLQIFMRPREADLEPIVQFHEFGKAYSENEWRLVAGPSDGVPLQFRAQAWVHDNRLHASRSMGLPLPPNERVSRLLYVFSGQVTVAGMTLANGESVLLDASDYLVVAVEQTDLVLFTTDTSASVFTGGMFSGNVLSA